MQRDARSFRIGPAGPPPIARPGRCSSFGALLLAATLAACAPAEPQPHRRFAAGPGPATTLVAGGVARPAWRLGEGTATHRIELANLGAGELSLFVAAEGEAAENSAVHVEFRESDWRSALGLGLAHTCTLRWGEPGTPKDPPWQACRFELPRAVDVAELILRRSGAEVGDILVSELHATGGRPDPRPSAFVLLLDAARFDQTRPFARDAAIGDRMEELAADGIVLDRIHSSSSWTRPAAASLFTGLRADHHRVGERGDVLPEAAQTLAEILSGAGWSTAGWSTNPNVLPMWGMAQGFDAFMDLDSAGWIRGKTDGSDVLGRLRSALAGREERPGFYYLHLMDPHAPYVPGPEERKAAEALPEVRRRFPRPESIPTRGKDWNDFLNYLGELIDVDAQIGVFVDMLKSEGLYDDSLILVVADHGEEFLDHGGRDHGRTLHEEVLRIPALLKLPGNRHAGTVLTAPTSIEDLAPTILDALGIEAPAGIDGRVLAFERGTEREARQHVATLRLDGASQATILDHPWKLIRDDVRGTRQLYELRLDPKERSDVAIWNPAVVERLTQDLDRLLSEGQQGWHLLLCGGTEDSRLEMLLASPGRPPAMLGFEEDEAVRSAGDTEAWRLEPQLTPRMVARAVGTRIAEVPLPEQVEVRVPVATGDAARWIRATAASGREMTFLLGPTGTVRRTVELNVDEDAPEVRHDGGSRIECAGPGRPVATEEPFVRVWFVSPGEQVADEDVDPATLERLRALGYLQ